MGTPFDAKPSDLPFGDESAYLFSAEDFEAPTSSGLEHPDDAELHPVALAARRYLKSASEAAKSEQRDKPPAPKAPFLIGVFEFPFYPSTLQCLIPLSLLLWFAAVVLVFSASLRATLMVLVFTFGYMAACCLRIVELSAEGVDAIDDWPAAAEWKEWMWAFFQVLSYLVQAILVAFFLTWWSGFLYWIPTVVIVFITFPIIALAAMEAGSCLPTSTVVLQTLKTHPWAWATFYAEATLLVGAWCLLMLLGVLLAEEWSGLLSVPLFAAVALIYARLMGRLAWCLNR
jgi:hypothetical protein